MKLLFNDQLAPITSKIGFVKAPLDAVVHDFINWQQSIMRKIPLKFAVKPLHCSLEECLRSLLPLTSVESRRYLFLQTTSPWVAVLDNGHQGPDPMPIVSLLAMRLQCMALSICAISDTYRKLPTGSMGRYGGLILEAFGPKKTEFLNYLRSIELVNDGGRWEFSAHGTAFPFEDLSRYKKRSKHDRFTFELLVEYLDKLGLQPFQESFYGDHNCTACIIEKQGPMLPNTQEYTLAEIRARDLGT